ncbi:MAG TPA: amidohydrolase family protein [Acidimicrobiales bacterium]|nr:amidohydrolase family protein [Acidimicrobiales bacterium]
MTALDTELFLPEPEVRVQRYTVISVDDHVVEPAHMFEGRLPAAVQARAPRIVETPQGHQVWEFEGERYTQVGMNAVAGRRPDSHGLEPFRFEQMRPGCYDVDARIRDMDINGVWASVNFPSQITGFCGRVFFDCPDPQLGLGCIRAWNDWLFEEWFSRHPDRIVPLGITYLADPEIAAAEIRRNAERGFTSVTFPERPHEIGLPSLWDRQHWDPIIEAVVETDMVVSLHVGSSGMETGPPGGAPLQIGATLFGQRSLTAATEWLWSEYPLRHSDLKIAMSEGGIGWVAMLIDRLDNMVDRSGYGRGWKVRPSEVLRRNFWFCTLDDPSTIDTRHAIGVENIMVEVDYPHGDGTWPDTQRVIEECWGHIPTDELRAMCCENASALYRHPLPDLVLPS